MAPRQTSFRVDCGSRIRAVSMAVWWSAILVMTSCARPAAEEPADFLRIWQTEQSPAAIAVLREIGDSLEQDYPGTVVEIENIPWSILSSRILAAVEADDPPDVAHLQPFMVSSMVHRQLLEPLDALYRELDTDDIYPVVRDLQLFDGHRYGIAHALGITYFGYRKDIADRLGLQEPETWDEYLTFIAEMVRAEPDQPGVLIPGGEPHFVSLLVSELLANNGGRLFDDTNRPQLMSREFLEVLRFLIELAKFAPPDWQHERFIDQYRHFAGDAGLNTPVTYGRAARRIAQYIGPEHAGPDRFAVMPQPIGPSGTTSYAGLDAEAFVVFRAARNRDLAMEFLRRFYQRDTYLRFCHTVPIHLTPIFRSLAESEEYHGHPYVQRWMPWQELLHRRLAGRQTVPLLTTRLRELRLPYLMELENSQILSDLVLEVAFRGADMETAARDAQARAETLIEDLGYRRW